MPNYRRAFAPGGCWFFTVNLLERRKTLLVDCIDLLRESVAWTRRKYPFEIDAFVVLPDHMHAIWTLPPGDADFSIRWRLIKTNFAKSLTKQEQLSAVRKARGERGIWQRRFWEHMIRSEADYPATLSTATLIRSSTDSSRACAIGRIRRFIATSSEAFFRLIGRAMLRSTASLARLCKGGLAEGVTHRLLRMNGGLRFANPPYRLRGGSLRTYSSLP